MQSVKKILITFVDDFLIASYLAKEFADLAIDTEIFITNHSEHWLNRFLFRKINKLAKTLGVLSSDADFFYWSPYSHKNFQNLKLKKRIEEFKPDLILCIHGQRIGEEALKSTQIPKVGWWVEPNPDKESLIRFARLFDLYLSYDSEVVDFLNNLNIPSQYQSHVASPSDFYPLPAKEKECDVLLYGGWSPWREEVLFAAYQATKSIALYGNGWLKKSTLFSKADLSKIFMGEEIVGTDLNEAINSAKIVLNAQRLKGLTTGLDTRAFDVLASGALLLTDAPKDLFRHFKSGEDLIVYAESAEIPSLIRGALGGQMDIKKIREAGRNKVLQSLTYKALSQKILKEFDRLTLQPRR